MRNDKGGSSHHHTSSSRGQGGRAGAFQALLLTGTFVILGSAGTITYLHRAKKKQAVAREKLKEFSIGEDHWDRSEIQDRVRESYYRIQECWRDRDLEKGHPYLSQKMQQEFQTKFEWSRMRHEVFVMEGIQLLDAILVEAENEDGYVVETKKGDRFPTEIFLTLGFSVTAWKDDRLCVSRRNRRTFEGLPENGRFLRILEVCSGRWKLGAG